LNQPFNLVSTHLQGKYTFIHPVHVVVVVVVVVVEVSTLHFCTPSSCTFNELLGCFVVTSPPQASPSPSPEYTPIHYFIHSHTIGVKYTSDDSSLSDKRASFERSYTPLWLNTLSTGILYAAGIAKAFVTFTVTFV